MKCPSCGAAVEDGADLCLECGEPMGDSPAARLVRQESASGPASPPPPPRTIPAMPAAKRKWATEEPEPLRCPGCGLKTLAARCPSCGNRVRTDDE